MATWEREEGRSTAGQPNFALTFERYQREPEPSPSRFEENSGFISLRFNNLALHGSRHKVSPSFTYSFTIRSPFRKLFSPTLITYSLLLFRRSLLTHKIKFANHISFNNNTYPPLLVLVDFPPPIVLFSPKCHALKIPLIHSPFSERTVFLSYLSNVSHLSSPSPSSFVIPSVQYIKSTPFPPLRDDSSEEKKKRSIRIDASFDTYNLRRIQKKKTHSKREKKAAAKARPLLASRKCAAKHTHQPGPLICKTPSQPFSRPHSDLSRGFNFLLRDHTGVSISQEPALSTRGSHRLGKFTICPRALRTSGTKGRNKKRNRFDSHQKRFPELYRFQSVFFAPFRIRSRNQIHPTCSFTRFQDRLSPKEPSHPYKELSQVPKRDDFSIILELRVSSVLPAHEKGHPYRGVLRKPRCFIPLQNLCQVGGKVTYRVHFRSRRGKKKGRLHTLHKKSSYKRLHGEGISIPHLLRKPTRFMLGSTAIGKRKIHSFRTAKSKKSKPPRRSTTHHNKTWCYAERHPSLYYHFFMSYGAINNATVNFPDLSSCRP